MQKITFDLRVVVDKQNEIRPVGQRTADTDVASGGKTTVRPGVQNDTIGATGAKPFERTVAGSVIDNNRLESDTGRIPAKRIRGRFRKRRLAVVHKNDRHHDAIPPG